MNNLTNEEITKYIMQLNRIAYENELENNILNAKVLRLAADKLLNELIKRRS